jgi:Xaa-Pro aminopeptidase
MHKSAIEQNREYIETRLLSTGPGTSPWFQVSASYVIQKNDLVALDTDVVDCHGYYSDFSRTFYAGLVSRSSHQGAKGATQNCPCTG